MTIESQYFSDLLKMNLWLVDNKDRCPRENIISIFKDNRKSQESRRYQLLYWYESMAKEQNNIERELSDFIDKLSKD